jgi:hypothetical protein
MNQAPVQPEQQLTFTSEDWDTLCTFLQNSVIAETNLCSLAKNLGLKWPISGAEEIPKRYIGFSLDELTEMPEFYGKGNRLPLLYAILLETKQLDDPFAEMIEHFEKLPEDEGEARTPLEKLGVPMDFPVELMHFSKKTKALCLEGGHETLSQLIAFLMESRTATIMNDEFRQFLSCLGGEDLTGLAQFLPIREGSRGVFLAEAIAQIGRHMSTENAATLTYAYNIGTSNPDWSEDAVLSKDAALLLIESMKKATRKCYEAMPDQAQELQKAVDSDINDRVRFFVSLNDSDLEGLAIAIAMASFDMKPRFKGLISRFLS